MNKLKIEDIKFYELLAKIKPNNTTSFSNIINYLLNLSSSEQVSKKTIIIYINLKEKWIQFVANGIGINDTNAIENIWKVDLSKNIYFDFKPFIFNLGSKILFESKNLLTAFRTMLNLKKDIHDVDLITAKSDEILRSFKTATRITIQDLNYDYSYEEINKLFLDLKNIFYKEINDGMNFYFSLIDDGVYSFDNSSLKLIQSMNESKPLSKSFRENINSLTVEECDIIDNHEYTYKYEAYKGNSNIINYFFHNKENKFIISKINDGISIDVQIEIKDEEFDSIQIPLEIIKNIDNKILNNVEIDNGTSEKVIENDYEDLETVKLFLTKALNNSTNKFDDFEIIKDKLKFTYYADDGKEITMNMIKEKDKSLDSDWMNLIMLNENQIEQKYEYNLNVNFKHPFFEAFFKDSKLSKKIELFMICYAVGETICRLDGSNVNHLKYEINKLLRGSCDDK
ncbi:MAG: hypothetical protein ACRC4L_01850 [Mycoplasma sp.]